MNVASLNVLIGRSAGSGANTFEIAEFRVSHTARHSSTFTVPTEKYSTDSYTKLLMHFEGIDGSTTFIDSSGLNHTFAVTGLAEITTDYYVFGGDDVDWADYYWDDSTEQYKRFSDDMVCSWDYATFRTAWSANPVWCLRDLIINTRFGLGDFIDTTMIDLASFITASQYCENRVANGSGGYEKKHRLDIVLDSSTKALDALIQISQTFRGLLLYSSGTIRLKVDKADLPVQLFGMGNIVKDSFQQSWMSLKDRFSVIEAQYLDKNKLYCQEKIAVLDEVSIASGEPMRKQQLRVFCTSPSYAYREARFYLWRYKYLKRAVSFKAGIDAICCEAGDIINVSHDVPAWGASGRVVSGTSNTIVIDQQYTLQSGKTYQIMVRHSDDTIEEKTITTSPSATNTLTISGTFSVTPSAYDAYAVGEVDIEVKPFRIQEIKIGNDHLAEISAIEYNESIYDDSAPPFDTNYSALNLGVPDVTNLALTERLVKMSDGTIGNAIDVWWTNPDSTNYSVMFSHVRIYLSDDGGDSWTYYGEARSNRFTILDHLVDGTEYTIAVVSVGATGNEKDKATAPQETITLVGKSAPPSDVTSFLCNQSRDRLTFGWTGVADLDLFGYEIRFGDSWESGYVLATQLKNTNYIELNFPIGTLSYWIKAIDTSGNYSTNAKQATITVDNIPFQNIVVEYQEQTAWSGTKVDCSKVGDNIELDAGELTGTYTTDVRDAGYVANFGIKVETIVVDATSSDQEFDDDPDEEWDDSETKRFSGDEVVGAVGLEIRTSDDNVTWSDWIAYQAGDYSCRYFQLRATLTRQNTATVLQLTEMNYYADLPDCDEYGSDAVSVAGDGKSVAFTKMFHQDANVNIEILSGTGTYHRFSVNPDSTGFTVKLYDSSGTAVVGDFSWYAHGI
jgi:hypothetical protein